VRHRLLRKNTQAGTQPCAQCGHTGGIYQDCVISVGAYYVIQLRLSTRAHPVDPTVQLPDNFLANLSANLFGQPFRPTFSANLFGQPFRLTDTRAYVTGAQCEALSPSHRVGKSN
jgi:hypothetical protein